MLVVFLSSVLGCFAPVKRLSGKIVSEIMCSVSSRTDLSSAELWMNRPRADC